MANILVFNYQVPDPARLDGNSLRVFHLSRELAKRHRCFFVAFGSSSEIYTRLKAEGIYEDFAIIPPPSGRRSPFRHFSYYSGNQTRVAQAAEYQRVTETINQLVLRWRIDAIITHTAGLAEYVECISGLTKIMDATDCNTLAEERISRYEKGGHGLVEMIRRNLLFNRIRRQESRLSEIFDLITVASPVDRDYLNGLCRKGKALIVDIPNGVNPDFLEGKERSVDEIPGGIAFWGTLDFPPNRTAIHYFYEEVFLRFLTGAGITWFIIGKDPSQRMKEMAAKDPNIRLTGYVEDLQGLVSRIPIMINPMQIGAGLKNKVLEAFAMQRVVVSNTLGMEAIPAKRGVQYVHAESPLDFKQAIIGYGSDAKARKQIGSCARSFVERSYTWEKVGARYLKLFEEMILIGNDRYLKSYIA